MGKGGREGGKEGSETGSKEVMGVREGERGSKTGPNDIGLCVPVKGLRPFLAPNAFALADQGGKGHVPCVKDKEYLLCTSWHF